MVFFALFCFFDVTSLSLKDRLFKKISVYLKASEFFAIILRHERNNVGVLLQTKHFTTENNVRGSALTNLLRFFHYYHTEINNVPI